LRVDEAWSLGATRQWAVTEAAIGGIHRSAALRRCRVRRGTQPEELARALARSRAWRRGGLGLRQQLRRQTRQQRASEQGENGEAHRLHRYFAVQPPSMRMSVPVMNPAASEHR